MDGHLDERIKKQRLKVVEALQSVYTKKYHDRFKGRKVRVLVEKHNNGFSYGYSREYIYTRIDGELNIGDIYDVVIDDTTTEVYGHVAE